MLVISLLILLVSNSLTFLKKNIHAIFINRITSIVLLYSALLTFNILNFQAIGKGIGIFNGLFHITIPTQIIEILIFIIGAIILLGWPNNSPALIDSSSSNTSIKIVGVQGSDNKFVQTKFGPEYSLIALFSVLGSSLLICSIDLISMYLSIELQSFALYILATLNRDSHSSVSAGLKYFLLGGLSSCFILLGAGLVYSYTGLTNFESLYTLFSVFNLNEPSIMPLSLFFEGGEWSVGNDFTSNLTEIKNGFTIGLIITIVGFLFKVSAAPFHNWSPDVYDESPSIITMWLSIMAKLSIFIFLLEFVLLDQSISISSSELFSIPLLSSMDNSIISSSTVKNLLLISSLLSLIVGTVVGLAQVKIRRLLAYSSISHVGFLLLALAINTEKSIESFSFYIIQYSFTSLNIFLILLAYGYLFSSSSRNTSIRGETDVDYIVQLKGQFTENPILSISLAVCLLSMAGIPPLIGFFSKQFVLYSSIQDGYYFLSIVAIIVSVISASYYLKIVKIIFFDSENKKEREILPSSVNVGEELKEGEEITQTLTNSHSYIIALLTFIILLFFINPSILLYISQLIALNFF